MSPDLFKIVKSFPNPYSSGHTHTHRFFHNLTYQTGFLYFNQEERDIIIYFNISLSAKIPANMLPTMRLLFGLAAFRATLGSPVDFISISHTTLSPPGSPTNVPTGLATPESEALIAERTVSTTTAGGFTAPGWSFISCFTDDISARALLTQVYIKGGPEAMSVSQCNYRCWVGGYILSGVEFAHECWCDHALNGEYHVKVPESECNMACTGNDTETCGGANRIAIYEYNRTPAWGTWKPSLAAPTLAARSVDIMSLYAPIGCYEDSLSARMLRNLMFSPGTEQALNVETCAMACHDSAFPYAGLEFGQECFCDTLMQTIVTAPETECNMTCPGDSGEICGGNLRINIYSYNGSTSLTATVMIDATSSTITIPTNSAITAPGVYEPKGCYSDSTSDRTLGFVGSFPGSQKSMKIEPCQGACQYAGYVFAGLEFGDECWCDNAIRGTGIPVPDADCNMACSGNNSETCGGSNRINIFSFTPAIATTVTPTASISFGTGSTSFPPQPSPYFVSTGCYTDSRSNRTLGIVGDFPGAHGNMTLEPCKGACRNAGYMFAGVEFGDECWCDDAIRGIGTPTFGSDCNMPCSGNASETCGGSDRINIYQLILAPISVSSSAAATAPLASPTTPPNSESICTEYYTVAQGDYCYSIWTDFGISQEQFTSWNPSLVFPQCQILVGQALCVQQGPTSSAILTVTSLRPTLTPTDEIPATALIPETVTMSGPSTVVTPTIISTTPGLTTAISDSTVSCSVFYQVAANDSCYKIWSSFGISQDQFILWNPSLVFPGCQIFPGDFVCVQVGQGSPTTRTMLPAGSTIAGSDGIFSTSTVTMTSISTSIVMTSAMSSSGSLPATPFTVASVPTSTSTSLTSEVTSGVSSSKAGY